MIDIIEDGAIVLLMSIGHRTGLFDVMANRAPSTAAEIADAADLSERYVREWLGAMEAGGIICRDAGSALYVLPAEHATSLSQAESPYNLAALAQHLSLAASLEDRVVERSRTSGPVPYSECSGFQHVLRNGSGEAVVSALLGSILPLVPGLADSLATGIAVLDIGCGDGRALNLMARIYPRSRFRGYGESESDIDRARYRAFTLGMNNVEFLAGGINSLGKPACCDLVLDFDGIHDEMALRPVVTDVGRALRPGGVFLMQESAASSRLDDGVAVPVGEALRSVSRIQGMSFSAAESGETPGAIWGETELRKMFLAAGFDEMSVRRLAHHVQNRYFVATKG
jgi:SAM-dependent methyltransferase